MPNGKTAEKSTVKTVTKKDLIERIAEQTGYKRVAVKRVVQDFLNQVCHEVALGNRLEFRDFGVFEVKARAQRTAQNPKTLERVTVPPKRTVKFKVGRKMKEMLEADAETLAALAARGETCGESDDDEADDTPEIRTRSQSTQQV